MKATVQLEWKDYLAALRLNARPRLAFWIWAVIFYGMLALTLILGVIQWLNGEPSWLSYVWPLFIIGAAPLLFYFVFMPFQARQIFQQMRELHGPMTLEVSPAGLQQNTALSQSLRPWSFFIKWSEDRNILILYIASNNMVMVPKRGVPEPMLAAMRDYLKAAPRPAQQRAWLAWGVRGCLIYFLVVIAIVVLLFQFRQAARDETPIPKLNPGGAVAAPFVG